uniref:Gfo/Idh/MocA-like oxidoreductase N-terminal domain-containing protein n=1 Tax=Thalassionema nitzschioides TaxID=33649 RepID=A0A7S1H649_9STRA|mmetsp:Transcript_8592/g.7009  ORF Transcript_8592/g.7009 Transcript_8592/m.7009 type:complete len:374 (+) Transcript_8592:34-1155(+)
MAPTTESNQCEIVLVGCGAPLRGMGWYHAQQLLQNECPSGKLCYVVEPWFMGGGAQGPGGPEFAKFMEDTKNNHNVEFLMSVKDLPPLPAGRNRLALISGRTADNPRLLKEAVDANCKFIYLEKPGAPTVGELEGMREVAKATGVTVLMGYNKNVCKYVRKAREFAAANEGSHVTFVSNNTYESTAESLGECFERNCEGMLKNMAIHELALLVSFYDVKVDNIASVKADRDFSSCQTLKGPSGKEFTDFDKIKFTIETKTGKTVSVQADRCGGDTSYAKVEIKGEEVFRHSMPDDDDKANVEVLEKKYPGAMPYFFSQDPDYITVKERVSNNCANGVEADGVATLDIAVDTLKVAEFLTPELQKQLAKFPLAN